MTDGRRLAYLEALGVDVYVRRGLAQAPVPMPELEAHPAVPASAHHNLSHAAQGEQALLVLRGARQP